MVCAVCKNPDGPCSVKKRDCSFFMASLPEGFEVSMAVPCYIRDKINNIFHGVQNMLVKDSGGQGYSFDLQKLETKTCISGEDWERFLNDYEMGVGDIILFELGNNYLSPMFVTAFDANCKNKKKVIADDTSTGSSGNDSVDLDEVYNKHSVVVITRDLDLNAQQLANWEANVTRRGIGFGPLFVHKLTDSNTLHSQLRIPKKNFEALNLEPYGVAILRADNTEDVRGTFSPTSDGRMLIGFDAWAKFVSDKGLEAGLVVMFLFHATGNRFEARREIIVSADVI